MASATQFVVVEASHSDAKWFNYYQQLLHHFYWASVWWPPNATVQKHNADGTGGSDSLTAETKVESSLNQVACTEDEQDGYESCSDGGTSEGCSVYSCSSRVINNGTGSRYFHHEFDEHGQDLPDYSCTEIRRVDSQYNSSCLRQRIAKWPSRRKKRSVVGGKSDEPLRNSLSNTAPQWEALPQDGQPEAPRSCQVIAAEASFPNQSQHSRPLGDAQQSLGIELCDWRGDESKCFLLDDEVLCRSCLREAQVDAVETQLPTPGHTQQSLGIELCDWCGEESKCFLLDDEVLCRSCLREAQVDAVETQLPTPGHTVSGVDQSDDTCFFCGAGCRFEDRGICTSCGGECREEDLLRCDSSSARDESEECDGDGSESACDLCNEANPTHRRGDLVYCHSCYLQMYKSDDQSKMPSRGEDSSDDDLPDVAAFPPGKFEFLLQGLVSSAALNGHWAILLHFHKDRRRWEATVSGKQVLVKMENIDFNSIRAVRIR